MSTPIFRATRDPARPERWTIILAETGAVQCRLGVADTLAGAAAAIARQTGGTLLDQDGQAGDVPAGGGGA